MSGLHGVVPAGRYGVPVGEWEKHPKKELESVLGEFALAGWGVSRRKRYYRVLCPCGHHQRSIHLSPSDPAYAKNALMWLYRQPCYEGSQ